MVVGAAERAELGSRTDSAIAVRCALGSELPYARALLLIHTQVCNVLHNARPLAHAAEPLRALALTSLKLIATLPRPSAQLSNPPRREA